MVKQTKRTYHLAAAMLLAASVSISFPAFANGPNPDPSFSPQAMSDQPGEQPALVAPANTEPAAAVSTNPPQASDTEAAPGTVAGNTYVPPAGQASPYVPPAGQASPYVPPAGQVSSYVPPAGQVPSYAPPASSSYVPPVMSNAPVAYTLNPPPPIPGQSRLSTAASTLETVLRVVNALSLISGAVKAF